MTDERFLKFFIVYEVQLLDQQNGALGGVKVREPVYAVMTANKFTSLE